MIKGKLDFAKLNDYGYPSIKVQGTWYGGDKKGAVKANTGDLVQFEGFMKPASNGKEYPTFRVPTFKVIKAASEESAASDKPITRERGGTRDTYWADKAATDGQREPRIAYQGAIERAISFVQLALANGAITAYEKAKPTAKLELLDKLVAEYSSKFFTESWAAVAPKAKLTKNETVENEDDIGETDAEETEESESEEWGEGAE